MSRTPPLESLPDSLLDTLVSHILQTCPSLAVILLSGCGTGIHASAVRVLFTSLAVPDDARYFLPSKVSDLASRHRLSAILLNSDRYARAVKRITITDNGLPLYSRADVVGLLELVTIKEEGSNCQDADMPTHGASQPIPAENLNGLLTACTNLEEFSWSSPSPPPDGICEVLSEHNPRLVNFTFQPEPPLRLASGPPTAGIQPPATRPAIPKWDAPSLPLMAALPLTKLHITRLSQQGSRALAVLFAHLGEDSLLEDVNLDFVWLDDSLCERLVEAGRRVRRLKIGTSGTKLTDKGIVSIFEGCDALEDFGLIEAQGRLSRNLWSKLSTLPTHFNTFKIAISESGPHHSWTADHLLSFSKLQLDVLFHLSVIRITQPPHFSPSGNILEYDKQIDDVAALKAIPRDIVASIRGAMSLTVLECDWWAWRPEDVKALLERCTQLEYLKLAFDAPFSKLLTLTSAFTPLTRLLKLSVSIPPEHAPGSIPVPSSPAPKMSPTQPLTPAASPVRRRTSLPSSETEYLPQIPCLDDLKCSGPPDPSLPLTREVKRFVKKCPRLIELEWFGPNGRGKWLVSRSVTTSKINTNVTVEYHPPVASHDIWTRARRERALADTILSGNIVSQDIERQGQVWTGLKAEQFLAARTAEKEKEKEEVAAPSEKLGRPNGAGRRASNSLAHISASGLTSPSTERQSAANHSPLQPFTPLSPPTSTKSFAVTQETVLVLAEATAKANQSAQSPRRTPSEPSLRTNGSGSNRTRSATASGSSAQGGSGSSRGRNSTSGSGNGGHRDGRGRGGNASSKSGGGGGPRRNSTTNGGGGSTRTGGGGGRGHGTGRGGKRKTPTSAT